MRLRSLVLERYGAFSDQALRFHPGARIHVVHGANEAGKTSALTAIGDFLFGFGHTTPYGFAHDLASLRIAATLTFADGTTRTLRRRKGRGNTLLDEADRPLADDVLAPRLDGLTRLAFDTEFGLTAEALRKGGVELMKAGGRLAETLAASSATLSALVTLRGVLDAEADELFRPTRTGSKEFYLACDRHKLTEQRMRDAVVTVDAWKEANAKAAEAAEHLRRLQEEAAQLRGELERLERARRTRPKLVSLADIRAELACYADLGEVPAQALGRWREAAEETSKLAEEAAALAAADEADQARIAAFAVDDAVLAVGSEIDRLRERIGAVEKARFDLPRRIGARRLAWEDLAQAAARLGLPSPEALLARQPTDAAMARVRSLLGDGQRAVDRLEEAERTLLDATAERDRLAQASENAAPLADPTALKLRLDAFSEIALEAEEVRRETATVELARRDLAAQTAALHPSVACLNALASRPLPTSGEIARAAADAAKLGHELRQAEEALATAAEQTRRLERDLERLAARGGAVATVADLLGERRLRDAALALLEEKLAKPLVERQQGFEAVRAAVLAIDAVTDRILADIDRAARCAKAQEDLLEAREREAAAAQRRDRAREQSRSFEDAWIGAWAGAGIVPGAVSRMAAWRDDVARALQARNQLNERESRTSALRCKLESARGTLAALALEAGVAVAPDASLELLHRQTAAAIEALRCAWSERRHHERTVAKAVESVERAAAVRAQRHSDDARWRRAWPAAVAALGLPPDAGFAEAEAALAVWQRVPGEKRAYEREHQSVEGIERDLQAFESDVGAMVARVAADLVTRPAAEALPQLNLRLAATRKAHEQRRMLEEAAADRQVRRAKVQAKLGSLAAALEEARYHLGLPADEPLGPMLSRLAERQALQERWRTLVCDLATVADGADEAMLRAEQTDIDFTAIAASVRDLQQRLKTLSDEEILAAHAGREQARAVVADLSQGRDAAEAAHSKAEAAADLLDIAERWLVRAAAAKLAALAIEQHRATVQDPLLARASQLFASVTGGAFRGLTTKFDEKDALILAGERRNGNVVEIEGMSEGTRDQLFLVLRLALLERQAQTPLPFIGDDLLASFDEERTAQALDVLAEFGAGRQVILFTHHAHVVDIARRRLGGRADVIGLGEAMVRSAAA